jgi:hypothetical protein
VRADPVVVAAYLGEPEQVAEVAQPPPVSPVRS